jgi:hypothetical protein
MNRIFLMILILVFSLQLSSCQKAKNLSIKEGGDIPYGYQFEILPPKLYSSVWLIKYKDKQGSGFWVVRDSLAYLVTAKHIFEQNIQNGQRVVIDSYNENRWRPFGGNVYIHKNKNVDIAVIVQFPNKMRYITNFERGDILIGDNGYLVGYPYSIKTDAGNFYHGNPIPLIKKSIFSGVITMDSIHYCIMDGGTVGGFSGGPAIVRNYKTGGWALGGVIKGSLIVGTPILKDGNNTLVDTIQTGFSLATAAGYIFEIIDSYEANHPKP